MKVIIRRGSNSTPVKAGSATPRISAAGTEYSYAARTPVFAPVIPALVSSISEAVKPPPSRSPRSRKAQALDLDLGDRLRLAGDDDAFGDRIVAVGEDHVGAGGPVLRAVDPLEELTQHRLAADIRLRRRGKCGEGESHRRNASQHPRSSPVCRLTRRCSP